MQISEETFKKISHLFVFIILFGLGLFLITYQNELSTMLERAYGDQRTIIRPIVLGFIFVFVGLGYLLFKYLQGNSTTSAPLKLGNSRELQSLFNSINEVKEHVESNHFENLLKQESEKIQGSIVNALSSIDLDTNHKNQIAELIKNKINEITADNLLKSLEDKYAPSVLRKHEYTDLVDDFIELIQRLSKEISALTRRANSNLSIGSILTLVAMGVLGYIVMNISVDYSQINEVLSYYIPRISFIIFIEVFAFFFLKLYKSNLEDIKYYQNELTNVQSKIISLKTSIMIVDDDSIKLVIRSLCETERNFILKKGETTIELEKSKLEIQSFKEALNLSKLLPTKVKD